MDLLRRQRVTLNHPIVTRWSAQYPDRLQLFSLPTPNGVKVGIMLKETGLVYEPHRIDILARPRSRASGSAAWAGSDSGLVKPSGSIA
jgi:hypothetical protein